MKRFLNYAAAAFQISLGAILCSGQTALAPASKEVSRDTPELSKFVGSWSGSVKFKDFNTPYTIILDIQPVKGREAVFKMEWPHSGDPSKSGPAVITPNSVSWVELESERGQPSFLRYMANLSTNNELTGKFYSERTLEERGSFALKKINPEELKAFRATNAKALERLHAVSRKVDFLDPAWRKLLPAALLWLDKTLGYEFKMIDEGISPDLEYAENLASAIERQDNLFAQKPGSEIPLWLNSSNDPSGDIKSYQVSFPKDFPDGDRKYPLLIGLHGSGDSLRRIHFAVPPSPRETPFIIVKPHSGGGWNPKSLNLLFAEIKKLLPVDEERVYLRGGSMGGIGTYRWAMANPEHFAAISPICGSGDIFRAARLKNIPIWMFHGEKDNNVSFWFSEAMLSALQSCGANVRYTFYPDAKHDLSGLVDYKALDEWFLERKRSKFPVPPDPIDGLELGTNGIGRKDYITLPEQRLASSGLISLSRSTRGGIFLPSPLYEVFQRAGVRSQGLSQTQYWRSQQDGTSGRSRVPNQVLALPKSMEIKDLPDGVTIIDSPSCRALSFAVDTGVANEREATDLAMQELKERGETPTGETRSTFLLGWSGYGGGRTVKRIDILLK